MPYLFDCKVRLTKFFFHYFMRLIVKGGFTIKADLHLFISLPYGKVWMTLSLSLATVCRSNH